jgi:predicted NBD/HSP70 family sugar kinase
MGRRSPGSLRSLRERNRLQVLEVVRGRGSVSRADIARHTGLARSTVSTLVNELLGAGLLVERGAPEDAAGVQGRPPVLLSFDPGAGALLGMHFDHPLLRVAVADLGYAILAEASLAIDVDNDAQDSIDAAVALVDELLATSQVDRERLLGAGVALAGPVDQATGTVDSSAILPGWVGMSVAQVLGVRLGVPVHVDNDANLGALAESVLGAGRGVSEMAYIMLGSGIGAGLIIGGQVYRGSGGTAGEIGHVLVDEHGPLCRCGNRGCLETYAGADALLELLRRQHGDALTVDGLVELARAGDAACQRVITDAARFVGVAAATLCNQLNPEMIVLGGELAQTGSLLLDPLRESIARYAIPSAAEGVRVLVGELGERAELLGALVLVLGRSDRALTSRLAAASGGVGRRIEG